MGSHDLYSPSGSPCTVLRPIRCRRRRPSYTHHPSSTTYDDSDPAYPEEPPSSYSTNEGDYSKEVDVMEEYMADDEGDTYGSTDTMEEVHYEPEEEEHHQANFNGPARQVDLDAWKQCL